MLPKKTFLIEILTFDALQQMLVKDIYNKIVTELSSIYNTEEARVIARIYIQDVLEVKNPLLNESNHINSKTEMGSIEDDLQRLKNYEPIQYVTGKTVFCGLPFKVNNQVLIPRPETEELVYWIIERNKKINPIIMDVCTGSGCIGISLSKKKFGAEVWATDVCDKALSVAKENADLNSTRINFIKDDALNFNIYKYPVGIDILVANPPYIPTVEKVLLDKNVVEFEPHIALFAPGSPYTFYHHITKIAAILLKPGGQVYFEIHSNGANEVRQILADNGFVDIIVRKDLNENERMICGVLKNKYF